MQSAKRHLLQFIFSPDPDCYQDYRFSILYFVELSHRRIVPSSCFLSALRVSVVKHLPFFHCRIIAPIAIRGRIIELSNYRIIELSNCRIVELSNYQIAKLPPVQNCKSFQSFYRGV